jgi:hypothetical protein
MSLSELILGATLSTTVTLVEVSSEVLGFITVNKDKSFIDTLS